MAEEIRCPMCSKLNPPGSEECGFCGARLKPLVVSGSPIDAIPAAPASTPAEPEGQSDDDWLARMRSGPEEAEPAGDTPDEGQEPAGSPDWLGRLREVGPVEEGPPAGEIPDWLEGQAAEPIPEALPESEGTEAGEIEPVQLPDWLGAEADESAAEAVPEPEAPEAGGIEPAQIPDWLARVRDRQSQETEPDAGAEVGGAATENDEGWLARIQESGEPVGEGLPFEGAPVGTPLGETEPERMSEPDVSDEASVAPAETGGAEETDLAWDAAAGADMGWLEEAAAEAEGLTPDQAAQGDGQEGWLSELNAAADELEGPADTGKAPWLGEAEIAVERPFTAAAEDVEGPEPGEANWLKDLEQGEVEPSSWQDQAQPVIWESAKEGSLEWLADYDASIGRSQPEEQGEPTPVADEGSPKWLSELNASGESSTSEPEEALTAQFEAPPEPPPEPEPAVQPGPAEELPHVPALVLSSGEKSPLGQGSDFDLGSIETELPDWLGEQKAVGPGGEAEGGQAGVNLAPATLPAWLEAMRPISTFRSVVDVAEEEEETLESAGPLAGLRGVLMAEPVMAMPRAPTVGSAKLEVTERQYAQADLLHKMVEEEDQEAAEVGGRRLRVPLLRWLISAVMLVAVILPITTGLPSFDLPTQVTRDLEPLINLVNNVPVDRPSLIVFDFDPGYSGEMDAVAGAFLDQVMARGIPIVSLSTRPSGPALAVGLLDRIAARHGVTPGAGYMHLGYLSGGSTAVQIFAASPRDAVRKGFDLPKNENGDDVCGGWDCPMLSGVQRLSDFGMVAVISSGTENARIWAEQAHPFMGQVPLVMVLSAGAEPLIRPYYEALEPQVNGILSGLPAAVAYEQANVMPGEAHSRWNPFGAGLAVTEIMLVAGVVYGLMKWFLRTGQAAHE